MTRCSHFLCALVLASGALTASPMAVEARSFHGGAVFVGPRFVGPRFVGPRFFGPRFVGPYYNPYYAPYAPVYGAPYPAPYPYPVPYPAFYPAPYQVPVAHDPLAANVEQGQYTIYFEFDRDQLTRDAGAVVQRVAAAYRTGGNPPVHVIGHTDRAGTPAYNAALSQRRAETVRNALVRAGIPARAITIAWRGEEDPAVNTPNGAREPRNRRVLVVVGNGPMS